MPVQPYGGALLVRSDRILVADAPDLIASAAVVFHHARVLAGARAVGQQIDIPLGAHLDVSGLVGPIEARHPPLTAAGGVLDGGNVIAGWPAVVFVGALAAIGAASAGHVDVAVRVHGEGVGLIMVLVMIVNSTP